MKREPKQPVVMVPVVFVPAPRRSLGRSIGRIVAMFVILTILTIVGAMFLHVLNTELVHTTYP